MLLILSLCLRYLLLAPKSSYELWIMYAWLLWWFYGIISLDGNTLMSNENKMTSWYGNSFRRAGLCEGDGFPPQRAINAELRCFLCCLPEYVVKQTEEPLFMWRHMMTYVCYNLMFFGWLVLHNLYSVCLICLVEPFESWFLIQYGGIYSLWLIQHCTQKLNPVALLNLFFKNWFRISFQHEMPLTICL